MSEVAKLRELIERQCEAMKLAMSGFARTASHEIIQRRYLSLGETQQRLAQEIGEQEAAKVMVETYIKILG
ncbi:MAG: hypothetical protein IMW89_19160 [Ktedonobacteraceae bacterium]|nr:hypothetical protein [Ktedonobacteraceae bacterium]